MTKQANESLKEQEQYFRLFALSIGDCFWNWDVVAGTVQRSSGIERVYGYQKQDILTDVEWWAERIHPEDKKRVWETYDAAVAGGQSTCAYEYRFRRRDGSYAVVTDHVCLIRDATGKVVRSLGAMRDITEHKRAEEELKATVEELQRFDRLSVGREERMIELKREVNEMARKAGIAPPYDSDVVVRGTRPGGNPVLQTQGGPSDE